MYDLHQELIDALKSTPQTLQGLLSRVTVAEAKAAKGGDENWSVLEVICHLRDAEEISFQRMRSMRDQDHPQIIGYDQEALARERSYSESDLHAALNGFIDLRKQHVAALSALSPQQWERSGEHNEIGQITIFAHTIHKAHHDAVHCAQIARQLMATKE